MRSLVTLRLCRFVRFPSAVAGSLVLALAGSAQTAPSAPAAPAVEQTVKLEAFSVSASRGQNYGASNMASATRMNTPIENVPQTVSVMNAALLADIDAYSLDEALRYTPGATQRQNSPDGAIIRGLASTSFNHYEDGFAAPALAADMANIDRIELIKGPSASVAGASESTGFLNYITKKPLFTAQNSANLRVGSWNSIRGTIDVTGPAPGFDNVAYRVIGMYMNADSFRDNEHTKKTAVYPSLMWKINRDTDLLAQVSYVSNFTPGGFGSAYLAPVYGATATPIAVPANAKIQLNRWMPLNVNSSGDSGMGRHSDLAALTLVFTHRFNDIFSFRQSGRLYDFKSDIYRNSLADNFSYDADGYLWGTYGTNRTMSKQTAYRFQGDLAIKLSTGDDKFSMRTLVGYDLARNKSNNQTFASANSAIPFNIIAPVYDSGAVTGLNKTVDTNSAGGSFGVFANTQIGLFHDYAILTGGIRRDQNTGGWTLNNLNGARTSGSTTPWVQSPLIGLTVKPTSWVALFGVYSDAGAAATTVSTYPGIPTTDARQIRVPVTPDTTNKEYGAKFTFFNGDLSLSASHFDTLQSGITRNQTDPSYPGGSKNFIDSGNRSKGFELSFSGNLTKSLSIFGGYTYDETSAPGFKPDGSDLELRGTPKNKVQVFVRYEFARTAKGSFGVKGGVVSQGSVYGRANDAYTLPGATRYDLGFDYHNDRWNMSTGVINLTNVIFPAFAVGQGSNTVDNPRNFYFSFGYKF